MIDTDSTFIDLMSQKSQSPVAALLCQTATVDGSHAATQTLLPKILSYRLILNEDAQSNVCSLTFTDDISEYMSTNPNGKYAKLFQPGIIDNKFAFYTGFEGCNFPWPNANTFIPYNRRLINKFTGFIETDANQNQGFKVHKTLSLISLTKQFRFPVNDTYPHPLYGDQTLSFFDPTYNLTPLNPTGVSTTSSTAVSPGWNTITIGSVTGVAVGQSMIVGTGGSAETVQITAVSGSTVTGFFVNSHSGTYSVNIAQAGTATQWQCIGRMFTQSKNDLVYGSSHIALAVYADDTGGSSPSNTPINPSNYSFDYSNAVVTFTSGHPSNAVVSLAGNPTYMAPEVMIKKILVELAGWSTKFLSLDTSNVLLPQFVAGGRTVWDCLKIIAGQTCPRFLPWTIWCDENANLKFYESRVDGPPVKTFLQGHNLIVVGYENSARQLRTVVRADGAVFVNNGSPQASEQPVVSIAYNLGDIIKYGQTEPLSLSKDVVQNARPLTVVTAMSYLNMMTASTLAQVSRPILSANVQIWPDPTLQPGDKIDIQQDSIGMTKSFIIKQKQEEGQGKVTKDILNVEEFYDSVNYSIGIPSGVSTTLAQASLTPPPSLPIIGAIRMGSGIHKTYPIQNGAYTVLPNGDQLLPEWYVSEGSMEFDYFINSNPASASTTLTQPQSNFDYYHLPAGYGFTATTDPVTGDRVYYGVDPGDGKTVYVGPDSVFYKFAHAAPITTADLSSIWVPPGNTAPLGIGGSQSYTGQTSTVYVWDLWYACLDGNGGTGKFFRPIQRINPSNDAVAQSISASGGLWVTQNWTTAPGPTSSSKYYGNLVLGCDNHTTLPSGAVTANVMGDGTQVGVAYGSNVAANTTYVNYQKRTKCHRIIFACNNLGQRQMLRIPFWLIL